MRRVLAYLYSSRSTTLATLGSFAAIDHCQTKDLEKEISARSKACLPATTPLLGVLVGLQLDIVASSSHKKC